MRLNFKAIFAASVIASLALLTPIHLEASGLTVPIYAAAPSASTRPQAQTASPESQKAPPAKLLTKSGEGAKSLPPPSRVTLNFIEAVSAGNMEMAKMLLQNGADINCRNCSRDGRTPMFAIYEHVQGHNPNPKMVWLLENGADPNIPDNSGITLLMYLAKHKVTNPYWSGFVDFEYLLRSGANVKIKDNLGNTALHYLSAQSPGDPKDMSRSGYGDSAYNMAKQWMHTFEGLIANGADINAVNKGGDTPLMYAAASCYPHLIETFLNYGADPSIKNKLGMSPLQIAIDTASRSSRQTCNRVVEILQSPQRPRTTQSIPQPIQSTNVQPVTENSIEWTGVFRATTPRRGNAQVTVKISPSGTLVFNSSSGLHGNGEISSSQQGQVTALVRAISPKDANGVPVFGANEIVFYVAGHVENGVMKGTYKSVVESGTFVLCSPEARQSGAQCNNPLSENPLSGLFDALRTLSGK